MMTTANPTITMTTTTKTYSIVVDFRPSMARMFEAETQIYIFNDTLTTLKAS